MASENAGALPVLAWLVLFGVFALDGTATLVRRLLGGEVWYQAHRSHAYQRAVQVNWTHEQVTRAVLLLNLVLAVLVWAGESWPALRFPAALVAFGGLAVVFWWVQRAWLADAP